MSRARALMLQGTGSHAGKTVLVAGLCRLLARQGLRVVPFKSQNMSLNAWVTPDGLEMGWAQAMQAEAAGVVARAEMNPILLKPRADAMSQVVVLGKSIGDVAANDYYRRRRELWPHVVSSYRALAREADVVLIEGAGSPAEPNLMARDLANMRVARMAEAPVLIVADIDRGGAFASLVGTMAILPPRDRRLVAGFIVNKFRGDRSLLARALGDVARRTRRQVLAVMPYLSSLRLPEEDSVALDDRRSAGRAPRDGGALSVAVVRLPHIANFTDFAPLETDPRVSLLYAERPAELDGADLVIIPGSKDTIADLRALRALGFEQILRAHVGRGGALLGICGGYQMLGRVVEDPSGVESGGVERGLGLLSVRTRLERSKTTRRVRARSLPEGPSLEAYEIHMGVTVPEDEPRPIFRVGRRFEGHAAADGRVRGTYLHGLFESAAVRERVLAWAGRASWPCETVRPAAGRAEHRADREAGYDLLADALERAIGAVTLGRLLRL